MYVLLIHTLYWASVGLQKNPEHANIEKTGRFIYINRTRCKPIKNITCVVVYINVNGKTRIFLHENTDKKTIRKMLLF